MKKRIFLFDNIKFLLIILVVVGHFADCMIENSDIMKSLYLFIYSFHMPFFIYMAGLFHKNENVKARCLSFIALGFYLKFLSYLCKAVLFCEISFSLLSDSGLPWFMFAMAAFSGMSYVLRDIDTSKMFILSVVIACMVGYDNTIGDYLYLSRIVIFYPFYLLGQLTERKKLIKIKQKRWLKPISVFVILSWAFLCVKKINQLYILRGLFTGRNPFSNNELFAFYGPVYRLFCMAIAVVMGLSLLILMPDKKFPIITEGGKRTLQIFFWHYICIYILLKLKMNQLLEQSLFGQGVWIFIGIGVAFILSNKHFSHITDWIQKSYKGKVGEKER